MLPVGQRRPSTNSGPLSFQNYKKYFLLFISFPAYGTLLQKTDGLRQSIYEIFIDIFVTIHLYIQINIQILHSSCRLVCFYFTCMAALFACMCVHHMCVCASRDEKTASAPPELKLLMVLSCHTDSEAPDPGLLEEHPLHLSTEPSF